MIDTTQVQETSATDSKCARGLASRAIAAVRSRLIQNILALSGVQLFRKTVPLITMPYLARVLGPSGIGAVAFVQGFAAALILLVEFGFDISATREVARCRDSRDRRSQLLSGVLGAQALLALAGSIVALFVASLIPALRGQPALLWAGLAYGVAESMNPNWYFQGVENMPLVAALEISSKTVAAAGIFLLVRSPEDAWRVLALQALAPFLSLTAALFLAYREVAFVAPSSSLIISALRMGWSGFMFRSAESLYTMGNAFILGLFAPPHVVGYFSGAEKTGRAIFGFFNPVRQALYPRLSALVQSDREEAARLARLGIAGTALGSAALGVLLYVFAPFIVRMLLGPDFAPSVPVLRLFSLLPVVVSMTYSIGYQWLLPLGKDAIVNRIILSASVLNIILAVKLAPRHAHIGMAWAVVCSQIFVCVCMIAAVLLIPSCKLGWSSTRLKTAAGKRVTLKV